MNFLVNFLFVFSTGNLAGNLRTFQMYEIKPLELLRSQQKKLRILAPFGPFSLSLLMPLELVPPKCGNHVFSKVRNPNCSSNVWDAYLRCVLYLCLSLIFCSASPVESLSMFATK